MKRIVSLMGIFGALGLAGCGTSNYGDEIQASPAEAKKRAESEEQKIQSNEHMPPQAKAAALDALHRSEAMGQGMKGPPGAK